MKRIIILVFISAMPLQLNGQLKGGACFEEITPELGLHMYGYLPHRYADGVADPLFMRALVLRTNERSFAIVNYDLGRAFNVSRLNQLRNRIKDETGIENVMFVATHTHSGPYITNSEEQPEWEKRVFDKTVEGIKKADKLIQPVKIGFGLGEADHTYNRRRVLSNGDPHMMWQNHKKLPLGPVDKTVAVIRIDDMNNMPLAVIVNYACHPVIYGNDNRKYSGDYVGVLIKEVSKGLPNHPLCFFANGASGDINPYYAGSDASINAKERVEETGKSLAEEVIKITKGIDTKSYNHGPLLVSEIKYFDVAPRYDVPELLKRLKGTDAEKARINTLTSRMDRGGYFIPLSVLLITPDIGWVGLPGEFWHKFQIDIRAQAPVKFVVVSGHTNGDFGYFPPVEDAIIGGYGADGYEAYTEVGTGELFVQESVIMFNKMLKKLKPLPRGYDDD
jgi:neutral ceramidase